MIEVDFKIENEERVESVFNVENDDDMSFSAEMGAGVSEHDKLSGRDLPNQHPISAITGLETALNEKQPVIPDLDEIRQGAEKGRTALQPNVLDEYATKQELNGKQPVIPDLEEIRQGAEKGKTAVQPDALNNYATKKELNGKQDEIEDLEEIRQGASKGENALPSTTKYAKDLSLTIDGQTYILTAQLKDQEGSPIGTEQTIDLPLETMIVGGSYDEDTKEVVLTLKNGETLRFSISDLISGLVTTDTEQTITGPKTFTQPMKIQNGQGTGSIWIGGNVNSGSLTNNQRHLARIVVPSYSDITVGATLLGFDTSGDSDGHTANKSYDSIAFGGSKKITNATSPMNIIFCVTKNRGSTSASDKVYPLEMDGSEARFNVQPNYNGKDLATQDYVDGLVGDIETALNNINSGG